MKHVVIVGGGFAGLNAAKKLGGRTDVRVTLVDRQNYHLFQPLLYQVAMAGLSPADIATPIRSVLARCGNISVLQGSVERVDLQERTVSADFGQLQYDYLMLCCGSIPSYFGHDDWEEHAPSLKTIPQATEIRRRLLSAFEEAERTDDPDRRRQLLTFVVIGGGPTGVELAGAIGEMSRFTLARDFRNIDTKLTRVILIESGPRILSMFSEKLASRATRDLEKLGVQVWPNTLATDIDEHGVQAGPERIASSTVLWAAGVRGVEIAGQRQRGVEADRGGRVEADRGGRVEADRGGRVEADRGGRVEADRGGRVEADRGGRVEADRGGRVEADRGGRVEADRGGRVEADRGGRVEADRGGRVEADRGGRVEADRGGRVEADRGGRVEADRGGRVEVDRGGRVEVDSEGRVEPDSRGRVEADRGERVEMDRGGRVIVNEDLSIPGHPNVFVAGDQACFTHQTGSPLPGTAPVAIQQGRFVAETIRRDLTGRPREAFRFVDKGQMATIGRSRAIVEIGKLRFSGWLAWVTWLVVHVYFLVGFKNRLLVVLHWAWSYLTFRRGARLIVEREWRFGGRKDETMPAREE